MEKTLWRAIRLGKISKVREILEANPAIDVNRRNRDGFTALHRATYHNYADIASLLLAHPGIDVNSVAAGGTPLFLACFHGTTASAVVLLKDSRVT